MQVLLAISILCVLALIWVALSIARYVNASHRRNAVSNEMPSILPRFQKSELPENDFRHALTKAIEQPQSTELTHPVQAQPVGAQQNFVPLAPLSEPTAASQPEPEPSRVEIKAQSDAENTHLREESSGWATRTTTQVSQPVSKSSAEPDETYYRATIAARISQLQQRAAELQQNVHDISSSKSWNMPLKPLRQRPPAPVERPEPAPVNTEPLRAERLSATLEALTASRPIVAGTIPALVPVSVEAPLTSDARFTIEAGTEALRKPPQPQRRGVAQRLDRVYAVNQDAGDLTDPYQIPHAGLNSGMTSTKQARS